MKKNVITWYGIWNQSDWFVKLKDAIGYSSLFIFIIMLIFYPFVEVIGDKIVDSFTHINFCRIFDLFSR